MIKICAKWSVVCMAFYLRQGGWYFWFLLVLFFTVAQASAQRVTTIAGTGTAGYSGDGGPATRAEINNAVDIALDRAGNLYIADSEAFCVRKIDSNGIISTVAGTGMPGTSGDGGPATLAQIGNVSGIYVDGADNLYIVDRFNHRIRKVDSEGLISTFAGTGQAGYLGDGGPATLAQLNNPVEVYVDDSGNVFISDMMNHRIRKVDVNGMITTVVGTGTFGYSGDGGLATLAQISRPRDIVGDDFGTLFFLDAFNHRVRKVDSDGIIQTVVGTGIAGHSGDGGPATQAQVGNLVGLALDRAGAFYLVDATDLSIRVVDPSGKIFTLMGSGDERNLNLTQPERAFRGRQDVLGVAVDEAGDILVCERTRIQKIASLSGAYVIRQKGTGFCLYEQSGTSPYVVRELSGEPENLRFVWNVVSRGGLISIQNAGTRRAVFSEGKGLRSSEIESSSFVLIRNDDAFFIAQDLNASTFIVAEAGEARVRASRKDTSREWVLERVGPVQKQMVKAESVSDLHTLDGMQVALGFDGYVYRANHERAGVYRSDARLLQAAEGWLAASEPSFTYRESEVFVVEYVGTWAQILGQQNEYAQECLFEKSEQGAIPSHVFVLKTQDGEYLQPEGETALPRYRGGDPQRPIIHLSIGQRGGTHPDYGPEVTEKEKAALFVLKKDEKQNGNVYLSAVAHQWHHAPSFLSEIKNLGKFPPVWGIVAPITLYSLQASHNMHTSKPWPQSYPLPQEHGLTTYPLGVSIPLDDGIMGYSRPHAGPDHFYSKICFTNNTQKDRDYNAFLGITVGWRYVFQAPIGSEIKLYMLHDDLPQQTFQGQASLLGRGK